MSFGSILFLQKTTATEPANVSSEPELDPILLNVPLQMLASQVALKRGREIDQPRNQPRNLAKSVTVE